MNFATISTGHTMVLVLWAWEMNAELTIILYDVEGGQQIETSPKAPSMDRKTDTRGSDRGCACCGGGSKPARSLSDWLDVCSSAHHEQTSVGRIQRPTEAAPEGSARDLDEAKPLLAVLKQLMSGRSCPAVCRMFEAAQARREAHRQQTTRSTRMSGRRRVRAFGWTIMEVCEVCEVTGSVTPRPLLLTHPPCK